MQTLNSSRTPVLGTSVGAQDAPTTSGKDPEKPVPQPPSIGTLEVEFRGVIWMLTQLVVAQSNYQNSALASFSSHDSRASWIIEFFRINPPVLMGSKEIKPKSIHSTMPHRDILYWILPTSLQLTSRERPFANSQMDHKKLLVPMEEMMTINTLVAVLMNYKGDGVPVYTEIVNALDAMVTSDQRS
ncbi:hypothetical protein HAX54_048323 [Datura stramonium]|uniref:Uncharacterized protein n=1 Tax=Datura stramonium TaxID=4076 RepID=A0ABS8STJ0_DATST|nr:hypothetical protein [Datura stramonium]